MTRGNAIEIRYRITGYEGFIDPDHALWPSPLPAIRKTASGAGSAPVAEPPIITHADYFQAVHAYLNGAGGAHLHQALAARLTPDIASAPSAVTVTLEKHGEFYHPARITIPVGGNAISLVLNVAVTPIGGVCMSRELDALRRVSPRLPPGRLPTVYGQAAVSGPGGVSIDMFMADWFDDFHEFHLSIDPRDGRQGIVVWDTTATPYFLSPQQEDEIHRQAACLLTRAYDPATTEQIYPWHHAAGDFVVRVQDAAVELRLITARQYAPTLDGFDGAPDQETRLMALFVFFLNLTLRNRIDRLDGTGPPAWAGERALAATVRGFFDALNGELAAEIKAFMTAHNTVELVGVLAHVADRYRLMPMERDLLEAHLEAHGNRLHDVIRMWPPGD